MSKGTQITLVKDSNGLFHPYNDIDYEAAQKIPVGEDNVFKLQRVRNPKFHRKYFAMIKMAFDNQDTYQNEDAFRKELQMRAGYKQVEIEDGKTKEYPLSISYGDLDQTQFEELYEKVFQEISKMLNMTTGDVELFLSELAAFA